MAPKSILPRKKIADFIDNLYDGDGCRSRTDIKYYI